ncbi:phosphotransferase [Chitinimonas arctica]|uniref:Phosphotransferase n=1 Tax=Chitinimonas arctica TaxID=2594795 RepID=A0A516SFZ5_9NEIS|nr:phosphotransferase [Chitinimonas arctica]QDQ27085.1 phosphotransferase [Chitinimonas arctica]
MERIDALHGWLQAQLGQAAALSAPIGDGSARRYFRLTLADGSRRIVMDAPPDRNDCRPFLAAAALLRPHIHVPAVLAEDTAQGFLLLEDLGDIDLQTALAATDEAGAETLYRWAIASLVALQSATRPNVLPDYTAQQMVEDLDRFAEWYADRHLGRPLLGDDLALWERCRALLVVRAQAQAKTFIHFDFHCRNLIVADSRPGPAAGDSRIGVIDFQDARVGPISYDLVSLLKDLYVQWPEAFRLDLCIRYWEAARVAGLAVPASFDDFYADFEIMGAFRHIRTLGTFARLAHRDGKRQYLDDMPLALNYLRETCVRYAELHPLYKLINRLTDFQPGVGYTF